MLQALLLHACRTCVQQGLCTSWSSSIHKSTPCCGVAHASSPVRNMIHHKFRIAFNADVLAQIYNRLQQMTQALPVAGNQDGSYLTAFSSGGLQ